MTEQLKLCKPCSTWKIFSEEFFPRSRQTNSGLYPYCKPCAVDRSKQYTSTHIESVQAYATSYYQRNRDNILARTRAHHIQERYGLTTHEYDVWRASKHMCIICFREDVTLVMDHNHHTNKLRDFICAGCNLGLGVFKENIDALFRAITYLQDHE